MQNREIKQINFKAITNMHPPLTFSRFKNVFQTFGHHCMCRVDLGLQFALVYLATRRYHEEKQLFVFTCYNKPNEVPLLNSSNT